MSQTKIDNVRAEKFKNMINGYVYARGMNIAKLAKLLSEKRGKTLFAQNLNKRINDATIKYIDVEEIADALGYKIVWQDKI